MVAKAYFLIPYSARLTEHMAAEGGVNPIWLLIPWSLVPEQIEDPEETACHTLEIICKTKDLTSVISFMWYQ